MIDYHDCGLQLHVEYRDEAGTGNGSHDMGPGRVRRVLILGLATFALLSWACGSRAELKTPQLQVPVKPPTHTPTPAMTTAPASAPAAEETPTTD